MRSFLNMLCSLPRMATLLVFFPALTLALVLLTPAESRAAYGPEFFATSGWLGVGLGWDVLAATVGMFGLFMSMKSGALRGADRWASRNTVTHTLFPFAMIVLGVILFRHGGTWLSLGIAAISIAALFFKRGREWGVWGLIFVGAAVIWSYHQAIGLVGFLMLAAPGAGGARSRRHRVASPRSSRPG